MSELRDQYLRTLGIGDDQASKLKLCAALNRAYQLRSFEIEHYWKRATYFWGFQIAIFAAFGLIWEKAAPSSWSPITLALAGLGILTALANSLSARGSKFWQENWETHIDMLEDEIEGRLHKTVWLREGKTNFSVSKINRRLSTYFIVFWTIVFGYVCWNWVDCPYIVLSDAFMRSICTVIIFLMVLAGICFLMRERSTLQGTIPNADGSHGERFNIRDKYQPPIFMRRFAPDEDPRL